MRIYKEMTTRFTRLAIAGVKWTSIPLGFAKFPKELNQVPGTCVCNISLLHNYARLLTGGWGDRWLRTLGNVVFESEHEHGGHFAAHEEPEELIKDIRAMFGKGGPAFGVVPGKNGYA